MPPVRSLDPHHRTKAVDLNQPNASRQLGILS